MIRSILQIGPRPTQQLPQGANKRRAGRVVCDNVRTTWGHILNASATGARINARGNTIPSPGETSVLTIEGPAGPFKVTAKVVWAKKQNWGKREIGIQFVDVTPQARAQLVALAEIASRSTMLDTVTPDGFSNVA
jgi:hypothetical protein